MSDRDSLTVGGRRELTYAVLCCLAGAALATFASTRTWAVELTARPAPLPALRTGRTGAELSPWLPALAVVGLAGAGAVLATRGLARRLVGGLLLGIGLLVAVGGGQGLTGQQPGGTLSRHWPALTLLGGVLVAAGGAATALRGRRWPAMGSRYDRTERRETPAGRPDRVVDDGPVVTAAEAVGAAADGSTATGVAGRAAGPEPTRPPARRADPRRTADAWDALDRGEDPTDT